MNYRELILSLITISIIAVFPHLGLMPFFSYSLPIILITWLSLKYSGEKFADLGFRWKSLNGKAFLVGAIAAVAIIAFMQLVFFPILTKFISVPEGEIDIYKFVRASPFNLVLIIIMGWIIGGLYEEIVFHGFIFTRLEKMISGKYATGISFGLTTIIFGAYHLQMGWDGALNALIVGAVYNGLFLYFKRNLWYSIFAHGVYDTIILILIYNGYF